jgi:hypothetical protein
LPKRMAPERFEAAPTKELIRAKQRLFPASRVLPGTVDHICVEKSPTRDKAIKAETMVFMALLLGLVTCAYVAVCHVRLTGVDA